MNPIDAILPASIGQALGWTLIHFVWQGGVIALLLATGLYLLRPRAARVRYALACGALFLLLVTPVVTFMLLLPEPTQQHDVLPTLAIEPAPSSEATDAEMPTLLPTEAVPWQQTAHATLAAALPWLVLGWIAGVLVLSMHYLAGWTYTYRLRRKGTRSVGQRWRDQITRLAAQLRIARPVRLFSSTLVQVPTVVGWLRPVILLPVSIFTGLTPRQVELVLAHELAHIRRHDYLVNLLQVIGETVLFYHPAVWWISGHIRTEREHCCDDLVLSVCDDAFTYAEALTRLEEVRQAMPRLALAATGGSLLHRIRRLLEGPGEDTPRAARWIVGMVLLATFLLSLHFSSAVDSLWKDTSARLMDEAPAHDGPYRAPRTSYEAQNGYEKTAFLLEELIFEDRSLSDQLETLDELRALPPRACISSLINIASWHPRERVRNEAVQWLGRLGDAYVVPPLEDLAFQDGSAGVQMEALDALRNLPGDIGIPSLVKLARTHPRATMRSEAVQWLGRLGDEDARLTLERVLYEDADRSVQMEALDALRDRSDEDGTSWLIHIARTHPRAEIRQEAVQSLDQLDAETLLPLLKELIFRDESLAVRREALDHLIALPAGQSVPVLIDIYQHRRFPQELHTEAMETLMNHRDDPLVRDVLSQ